MLKNVTITLDPEVAHWARKKAADENTSVSKLVSRLLEKEMRASDPIGAPTRNGSACLVIWELQTPIDASKRMTREEVHERR